MKKNDPVQRHRRWPVFKKMFIIMKLTTVLFFIALFQVSAKSYSQETRLNLKFENEKLENVFSKIEANSEFSIFYKNELIKNSKEVNGEFKDALISKVLDQILKSENLTYTIKDKLIMIVPNDYIPSESIAKQQGHKITGKVTDQTGASIPGASVVVKGTTIGITTDVDGKYFLSLPDDAKTLVFSFVGMKSVEVALSSKSEYNVKLLEESISLDEVVAIGYGVQKKSVVTAAISKVDANELGKSIPTNVQNILKGKVAGVQITSQSGQPGADSKIRIRGTGTVNDSDPLYIVDGMASSNGINYINPSDIESIEVLKDAASAAIYGARGANGVILVTTKTGSRMQKTTFNYEFTYGIQNPAKKLDLMNSQQYQMMMNEMAINSGKSPYFPSPSAVNTDWQKELTYKNAPISNHKLSVSGGNENSTYYASFGYISQSGILGKGYSDYERYNSRLNYSTTLVNIKERNWLNSVVLGTIISYSRIKSVGSEIGNSESSGILASMNMLPPTESVYQDDPAKIANYQSFYPNYVKSPDGRAYNIIEMREITNPLADLQVNHNQRRIAQVFGSNFNLDVAVLPGLKFKTTYAFDGSFTSVKKVVPMYDLNTTTKNTNSFVEDSKDESFSWQWENTLSYKKSFGLHNLGLLAGTSMASYQYSNLYGSDNDLLIVDINKAYIDIATADRSNERVSGGASDHKLASVFGRVNYNFDEKYLFEVVARRDGSSNFSDNHKYAIFPSVSFGWVLTRENFMKNRPAWLDAMKLRASWGQNGNESIGAFGYTSMMSMGYNAVVNGKVYTGAKPSGYVNNDLKWETSEQKDLGIDLRFFGSALTFSTDYFNKKTKDMLLDVTLPQYTGFYSMKTNAGTVTNEGVEFDLTYKAKIGEVNFSVGANASFVTNEVTNQGPGRVGLDNIGGGLGGTVTWRESGKPYGFFYGYVTDGIFQNQAEIDKYVTKNGDLKQPNAKPGDVRYKDLDGVDGITGEDRTMIGDPNPDWTYGLSLDANWKNFDLHAFFQGVEGNDIYKFYRRANITYANWENSWLGRWHGEGTSNKYPRVVEGDPNNNTTWVSDLFVEDGSYFRMKVLQLGYQLPQSLAKKAFISKLRFFVQAENLFTVTNYSGLDPEVGTRNGFDGGTYPQARTFTIGANIVF